MFGQSTTENENIFNQDEFSQFEESDYKGEIAPTTQQREGKAEIKFKNGATMTANYKDGKLEGEAKIQFEDGATFEGNMKNGILNGAGIQKWKNGRSIEGRWFEGKLGDYKVHEYFITDAYGIRKRFWYNSGDILPKHVPSNTNFNVIAPDYDDGMLNFMLNATSWGCFGYAYYRWQNFKKKDTFLENLREAKPIGDGVTLGLLLYGF